MKTILTIIALTLSVTAFSQVSKLRAETYSYHYAVNGEWEEWSKAYVSNDIIVFDYTNDKIKIFGSKNQVFDLLEIEEMDKKEDFDVYLFSCVDSDGKKCIIGMMHMNDPWVNEIYVYYEDFSYKYTADFIVE